MTVLGNETEARLRETAEAAGRGSMRQPGEHHIGDALFQEMRGGGQPDGRRVRQRDAAGAGVRIAWSAPDAIAEPVGAG